VDSLKAHPAEKKVLGTLMQSPGLLAQVAVTQDDFVDSRHRAIFKEMKEREANGQECDAVSMCDTLMNRDSEVGGVVYLSTLIDHAGISATLDSEVRQIRERKDAIELSHKLKVLGSQLTKSQSSAFQASGELLGLARTIRDHGSKSLGDSLYALDDMFDAEADGTRQVYMKTGISDWDNNSNFQGISTEGITLILGASGMGKTTFLNRLCLGLLSQGRSVYLHGSETSVQRRLRDLTMAHSGTNSREWATLTRGLSELKEMGEWDIAVANEIEMIRQRLRESQDWLSTKNLVVTGSGYCVEQVVATATNLHQRGKLDCVIVDYLQDIGDSTGAGVRVGDRVSQVSHKSNSLKEMSAQLQIACIVGAQVSGEKDGPGSNPKPQLWQTMWSASAHQDCEEAYALYVDDYYATRFPDWVPKGRPGTMEIIARKRRTGKLSTLEVPFIGELKWCGGPLADRPANLDIPRIGAGQ
tara:strand:+ start:3466 stop:4878 length:1413 start_codon:yes stop_codon:yes gene_type:complete